MCGFGREKGGGRVMGFFRFGLRGQVYLFHPFRASTPADFPPHLTTNHQNTDPHPSLTTKPIKRPPLPLQRIHDIQTRHRLALCMFGVRDRIADHALEERFQDAAGFFVDHYNDKKND